MPAIEQRQRQRQDRNAAVMRWHEAASQAHLEKRLEALKTHNVAEYKRLLQATHSPSTQDLKLCASPALSALQNLGCCAETWQ